MFEKPVAISLSPNSESDDVYLALKQLITPWKWKRGSGEEKVRSWFKKYFSTQDAYIFNSGRSAFLSILKSFGIGDGDEVIIQAFTCVAVPEVVMWAGATPVYADIGKDGYNLDPKQIEKKITKRTKAIVVQHTFGIPADIESIKRLADKHNIILIEDCAHALGASVKGKKIGSFGDAAFFSFGRDKVVSSVFGGAAIFNKKYKNKLVTMKELEKSLPYPSNAWIAQQLVHPILFSIILPTYNFLKIGKFSIGKVLLFLCMKLHILSRPTYPEENCGGQPKVFPKKLPNALATLAVKQLSKLERFNKKRIEIAKQYGKVEKGDIYLRYPVLLENTGKVFQKAKEQGMLLGTWYSHIVDPDKVSLQDVGYRRGSCPNAEQVAKRILNLPTYPTMSKKDVQKIKQILSWK